MTSLGKNRGSHKWGEYQEFSSEFGMSRYTLNMTFMKYKNRENHIQGEVLDIFYPRKITELQPCYDFR